MMPGIKALCAKLDSLINVTESLCLSIALNDIGSISELIVRRERLLEEQSKCVDGLSRSEIADHDRKEAAIHLRPLIEKAEILDRKIVTLLAEKTVEFSEKLRQAQNEKRLLAYSR